MKIKRPSICMKIKGISNLIHQELGTNRDTVHPGTMMQKMFLGYLEVHEDQPVFQKDLESAFHIRRSTATGILQIMVRDGLIVREPVEDDRHALHLLLFADGRPVGTRRAFTEDGGTRWHIGRVAVIQSARQLHLGRRMMDLAEAELRRRGAAGIEVSAQCRVQPFYEKCGFTSVGEVYLDEFCPHIRMVKEL